MPDITPQPGERAEITYEEFRDNNVAALGYALQGLHVHINTRTNEGAYPNERWVLLSGAEYDKLLGDLGLL
jgi:hypothetical protein